jgi:hypothetical protein
MFRTTPIMLALTAILALTTACGDDRPTADGQAADGPTATLTAPPDGARIAGAVDVTMAAAGITIVPAGDVTPGEGHFHVIADHGCLAVGTAIPKDADHVHFGTGTTTGTLYLEPGTHSLCLQVGDGAHAALATTDTVEINVGITSRDEFCDVVAQTDSLMAGLDTSDDAWQAQQVGYENVRRLLTQLDAATDHVDADARGDVAELVHWATVVAETLLAAESKEAAAEQLWGPESRLPADGDVSGGEQWVLDNCGVSIA